jgi:hypothetical protein
MLRKPQNVITRKGGKVAGDLDSGQCSTKYLHRHKHTFMHIHTHAMSYIIYTTHYVLYAFTTYAYTLYNSNHVHYKYTLYHMNTHAPHIQHTLHIPHTHIHTQNL